MSFRSHEVAVGISPR